MRWQALFDDLEAQLAASDDAAHAAEVADRTRRETALLRLVDRLRAAIGQTLALTVAGAGTVHGRLLDAGADWLLLEEPAGQQLLVPAHALLAVTGLGQRTEPPGTQGEVARRLDLRWALRGLARDRAGVTVRLRDGTALTGTLDGVGADYVDIAEHAPGEPRRPVAVRQVRTVPLTALGLLRSG